MVTFTPKEQFLASQLNESIDESQIFNITQAIHRSPYVTTLIPKCSWVEKRTKKVALILSQIIIAQGF